MYRISMGYRVGVAIAQNAVGSCSLLYSNLGRPCGVNRAAFVALAWLVKDGLLLKHQLSALFRVRMLTVSRRHRTSVTIGEVRHMDVGSKLYLGVTLAKNPIPCIIE